MPLSSAIEGNGMEKLIKIECNDISKTFIQKGTVEVPVIKDVSLAVHENEFLVILGPGQCGKSTLLRIIAGLEVPDKGFVTMPDGPIVGPGPDRGLVFQGYMLFAWETVFGNVEMGLKLRKVPSESGPRFTRSPKRYKVSRLGEKSIFFSSR